MRRLRAVFAVLTMGAVTILVAPSAEASLEDCPASSLCGWSGTGFTGPMTTFRPAVLCTNTPPIRSAANTYPGTGIQAILSVYSGPDCTGTPLVVLRGGQSQPFLTQPGLSVSTPI
jgi:hypothetical protein